MLGRWAIVAALLGAAPALAWPVDVSVTVEPGAVSFHKLSAISWVEVEDPAIGTAEVLPAGELLLSGKAPGRTLVLLYAEGRFAVWRLQVGKVAAPLSPESEVLTAAKKACGRLEAGAQKLVAEVPDAVCRKALLALFQHDRYAARDVELTFALPALQVQLAAVEEALAAQKLQGAKVRYRGAGAVLEGKLSRADHRKVLWTLFRESAGRVPLDDRSELFDEESP